jgi:Bacterial aa3 type cytochrome c oxidase subunit IV
LLEQWACDTKTRRNEQKCQGSFMAVDPSGGHPDMDYQEHLRTYSGFLRATIVLVVLVAVVLLFLLTLVP